MAHILHTGLTQQMISSRLLGLVLVSAHVVITGLNYKMVHILTSGHIKYPARSLKTGLVQDLARTQILARVITVDLINTQTHKPSMDHIKLLDRIFTLARRSRFGRIFGLARTHIFMMGHTNKSTHMFSRDLIKDLAHTSHGCDGSH